MKFITVGLISLQVITVTSFPLASNPERTLLPRDDKQGHGFGSPAPRLPGQGSPQDKVLENDVPAAREHLSIADVLSTSKKAAANGHSNNGFHGPKGSTPKLTHKIPENHAPPVSALSGKPISFAASSLAHGHARPKPSSGNSGRPPSPYPENAPSKLSKSKPGRFKAAVHAVKARLTPHKSTPAAPGSPVSSKAQPKRLKVAFNSIKESLTPKPKMKPVSDRPPTPHPDHPKPSKSILQPRRLQIRSALPTRQSIEIFNRPVSLPSFSSGGSQIDPFNRLSPPKKGTFRHAVAATRDKLRAGKNHVVRHINKVRNKFS